MPRQQVAASDANDLLEDEYLAKVPSKYQDWLDDPQDEVHSTDRDWR